MKRIRKSLWMAVNAFAVWLSNTAQLRAYRACGCQECVERALWLRAIQVGQRINKRIKSLAAKQVQEIEVVAIPPKWPVANVKGVN